MRLKGKEENVWVDFDKSFGKLTKKAFVEKFKHLSELIDLEKAHKQLKGTK